MGHGAADQPPFGGRCRIDHLAGKQQLGSARCADNARHQPGSAIARNEAELQEGDAELRLVRGDPDVCHAGHVAAEAYGCAIDRRDQRDF